MHLHGIFENFRETLFQSCSSMGMTEGLVKIKKIVTLLSMIAGEFSIR